jgi:FkbM family methyltransferase
MGEQRAWLDAVRSQVDFALAGPPRPRRDTDFDWEWFAVRGPRAAAPSTPGGPFSGEWLAEHAEPLWEVRRMLADDASQLLFDLHLVLRAAGPARFHFPRLDFRDWLVVHGREPFAADGLPADSLGQPLEVFDVTVAESGTRVRVIATAMQIRLCNAYRQYVPIRAGVPLGPCAGDVVFDCGACIGDFATLFAALVGPGGLVHLFDPVPLHLRYCHRQAALNPHLAAVLRPVPVAVGAAAGSVAGNVRDTERVSPGGLVVDAYERVSLDGYADAAGIARIDFVKMDIEGAELDALAGARDRLSRQRPRLAISAYHAPEHLWEIPRAIRTANPGYRLHFGHHMPVRWESVFYAV